VALAEPARAVVLVRATRARPVVALPAMLGREPVVALPAMLGREPVVALPAMLGRPVARAAARQEEAAEARLSVAGAVRARAT